MAIFFKCPLYTYIEVKLKICYYGGFSKIPYFNNKEEFPFIWKSGNGRKYQKLTKTDKSLDVKGKNCKHKRCKVVKTVSALSLN
jgi:hypothetical protein